MKIIRCFLDAKPLVREPLCRHANTYGLVVAFMIPAPSPGWYGGKKKTKTDFSSFAVKSAVRIKLACWKSPKGKGQENWIKKCAPCCSYFHFTLILFWWTLTYELWVNRKQEGWTVVSMLGKTKGGAAYNYTMFRLDCLPVFFQLHSTQLKKKKKNCFLDFFHPFFSSKKLSSC